MAYKGYKGCGPRKLGASPMKHRVKKNGKPKSARHIGLHEKHGEHDKFPSIGTQVGKVVNKVKDKVNVVVDTVKDNVKDLKNEIKKN